MIITGLRKKGKKVQVDLNDGSVLILNYEILMKNGLKINYELSDDRLSFIKNENLKYEIKQKALYLLSRRLHSSGELKTKLMQKYHYPDLIDEIINNLLENKYLDDEQFTAEFIEEKSRLKLWGGRKITAELKRRGIDNKTLEEDFVSGHLEKNDEQLRRAAEKKLRNLKSREIPDLKLKQKLIGHLLSKGFEYDDIKKIVDLMIKDSTEEL